VPLAVSSPSDATSAPTVSHKLRPASYQFLLTFDHGESLRAGTRVVDASGHRHAGVIVVDRGKLAAKPGLVRRGAQFPHSGRAIVQIADRKSLDPKRRSFLYGAAVKVDRAQVTTGANLVQKGYYNQGGGQWKLQLAGGGVPVCVVNGGAGRLIAVARHGVANGRWHRVSCARTPNRVVVWIDGKRAGSASGLTGRIANNSPVKVGGKTAKPGNKQFHGRMDNVFMRLLPPVR
jgi:hypothetical protein